MKPALAQVCSLGSSLEQDIEDYAAGQCRAIELWWGKLDAYLEGHSTSDLLALLAKHEMTAPVVSFQGGLLTSQGDYRKEHWASFTRRLGICQQLGIETMVVAGDIAPPLDQQTFDRIQVSLADAARLAAEHGLRLALEFQGRAALANNLQTAASLVSQLGSPHLGLCLDLFHFYVGPSKAEDLAYLTPANLFHVQLCDLAGTVRELASDGDRILPGEGDFQIEPIIAYLRQIGYQAYVSVELMNPQIWQVPPRQFGEIALTALRRVLGQASMGDEPTA